MVDGVAAVHDLNKKLLYMENVYKDYGKKRVLDNIDLSVESGEFCTLVGPSGCGKSTLFRLILGEERPTSGEILIDGIPVGYPDKTRGIVYQKYSLYPNLRVVENILLGPKLASGAVRWLAKKNIFEQEARQILAEVKLADHGDKYPHELSGGMQQRVAIAQALIMKPKILLMDEPFGALDPGTREHLQVFILELWHKFNMTVFFVTHDLEEALFLGTRVLVLSQFYMDGRGDGETNRGSKIVFDEKVTRSTTTDFKHSAECAELMKKIRESGFDPEHRRHVTEFNLRHPDSFQTLTEAEKRMA
ncbi:MAG: nitrate/sulfonate/bicarbonate ABC transporter ATP-binding protein [Candidatus Sungbacteria bacterium RIFCSPLOWO2_01_FULL_47_32]|uniref:Nitrate/sulfonate/bicarbonate ABC transporter ATP-binding protein n=1 Tax=Candidatus Sungbacteria bacterium RIFCSPHIGHO2_01_FULL_47_32 TaxID=1802264 RepID=A0A1G2K8X4_9BACT|nr:MAG: ABC transporter related protein [Parcubacteria group bacterium GW2011_GWA2_47_10]OGZ94930.1 MAG: nitrate/sulfonate/bicarbonate ABC transporter ATP-binding protein [Candidatus Sungbacteria bacterium RIFCSPHIGHO2_01_FULL_47_32]OHA04502.1 MAG: nitrate/sulfonate/bicarbonate ABC transporter ATP-binding protein [Candidatus Sungbacteria bacterium RIFCSPLOWO2_01_FULL_47_32]